MPQEQLFDLPSDPDKPEQDELSGEVRLRKADRAQAVMAACRIDDLIEDDHRARRFWDLLESFDLSLFTEGARSRGSNAGRPVTDPRVLLCLWLYATSESVGSARHLSRLIERDAPYRWIAGGMSISYHTLSDFRVSHQKALDGMLTEMLAALMSTGMVYLSRIAQDGTRVRANAGAKSYRRQNSLKKCLAAAKRQVKKTRAELDAERGGPKSRKQLAAEARAAKERMERTKQALGEIRKLQKGSQKGKEPGEVRASTTDPEARVMKHADGGYRPSFNIQGAVDTDSRIIVDVAVTDRGNDYDEIQPMLDRLEDRTGQLPDEVLVDGGYAKKQDIEEAEQRGVDVYAPQAKTRKGDLAKPRWDDGKGVARWRARMTTERAAEIYKQRAATIETVFGDMKQQRGMRQLPVRGIDKALSVALLSTLAYNLLRVISLGVTI